MFEREVANPVCLAPLVAELHRIENEVAGHGAILLVALRRTP